ncbi:MAG: hypothetical protein ABUS47_05675 [Steroidobacter sp.]
MSTRRSTWTLFVACLFLVGLAGLDAVAQTPSGSPPSQGEDPSKVMADEFTEYQNMENEVLLRKLMALTHDKAKAEAEVRKLITEVKLSCRLTEAYVVGLGKMEVGGRSVDTKIYEATCDNGVGYLLESQGAHDPRVVSCFAAAASHTADGVQEHPHEKSGTSLYCQLKANKDIKATAAFLIKPVAPTCEVSNLQWLGVTSTQKTEYTEVLCASGAGYILEIPRINSSASVLAVNCEDAGELGLQCHMSKSTPPPQPITMKTYLDALKDNGLNCEPVQLRVIGREHEKKRYVVEAQCLDHPQGIVAYLPLNGNANKFEMIDCNAAAKRRINCKFVKKY